LRKLAGGIAGLATREIEIEGGEKYARSEEMQPVPKGEEYLKGPEEGSDEDEIGESLFER